MKQLLRRPKAQQRVLTSNTSKPLEEKTEPSVDEFATDGSVNDSDSDVDAHEIEKKESLPPKKVVKRKVKKVVRKTGVE